MVTNILLWLVLVGVVVLFAWLASRAWRAKNVLLKWIGFGLAGLFTLLLAFMVVIIAMGMYDLYRIYPVAPVNISIAGTPEQVARGEHLASVVCAGCHSENGELPLSGGRNMSRDVGIPLGEVYPPNLTPAGLMGHTDADLFRIVRTGVEPDGQLSLMTIFPLTRYLSDDDLESVIAYIRHSPSVQHTTPPVKPSLFFAALFGLNIANTDAAFAPIHPVGAPPKGVTKEYGEYVMNFMGCKDCHGPTLSNDAPPPAPKGGNLTVVIPQWSKDDFFKAMRTGVTPTGHLLEPPMAWKAVAKLDDMELEALYTYLHELTPIQRK